MQKDVIKYNKTTSFYKTHQNHFKIILKFTNIPAIIITAKVFNGIYSFEQMQLKDLRHNQGLKV